MIHELSGEELVSETDIKKIIERGIDAIRRDDTLSAMAFFERASEKNSTPLIRSYLGFCIARERGQIRKAVLLCEGAIKDEPGNSVHYLNLGKVYMLADQKTNAMATFREGLSKEQNSLIIDELNKMGVRKPPVIKFLDRHNAVNKYIGKILFRLGLR